MKMPLGWKSSSTTRQRKRKLMAASTKPAPRQTKASWGRCIQVRTSMPQPRRMAHTRPAIQPDLPQKREKNSHRARADTSMMSRSSGMPRNQRAARMTAASRRPVTMRFLSTACWASFIRKKTSAQAPQDCGEIALPPDVR